MSKYTPHTGQDIDVMLREIGLNTVSELFQDIPDELKVKGDLKLNIPDGLSEMETLRLFKDIASKNKVYCSIFRGAGAYNHYIPSSVNNITSRSEFLTTYTPYQAEISQGVLQSIFDFQTMMCELTGLDVSNACVYDGATAAAEACKMTLDKKKDHIYVSSAINPQVLQVIRTYLHPLDIEVRMVPVIDGKTDLEYLSYALNENTACFYMEQLNFYGLIENAKDFGAVCQDRKIKFILGFNPIAAALLPSASECKADIAVGEGQPLGLPLSFGGPYLGIMTCTSALMRKLPGRIVGETVDTHGKRAFVLTLQAREQHIKREKSTSSICSNEALCAMRAAVYLSTVGTRGLEQVAQQCLNRAHYLADQLCTIKGIRMRFHGEFFHEFVTVSDVSASRILEICDEHQILAGYPVGENEILWCATEMNSKADIDYLVKCIKDALK